MKPLLPGTHDMILLGTLVNTAAIIIGSILGLIAGNRVRERYKTSLMQALGLAVIFVGLKSALGCDDVFLVIAAMAIGTLIGEWLNVERRLEATGQWVHRKLAKAEGRFTEGFVTASLLYCVGSMAVVGALESGLSDAHHTLFAKSILDGTTAVLFASALGIGVAFSALPVFLYQTAITLSAAFLRPYLTPDVVTQMSGVGGLLIIAIGISILEIKKLRLGNMLPAIFIPPLYFALKQLIGHF